MEHSEEIPFLNLSLGEKGKLGILVNLKLSGFFMSCQYRSTVVKTARGRVQ